MTRFANLKRLGFFTRLLDEAPTAERYRLATDQIVHAEKCGLDSAWIAQHHFHERENASLALEIAHEACVLQTGRIVLSGPARALKDDPRVRDAYLGGAAAASR